MYINDCYAIDNNNRMRQYDLLLDKYWVTQSVYFRLATTVALGMVITEGNILVYHGIPEESDKKKISLRYYNARTFYEFSNNYFPDDLCRPVLNLPPIPIDDSSCLDKLSQYTPDLLPYTISFSSENSVITLTAPYDYPKLLVPNSDYINPQHNTNKENPVHSKVKRGFFSRRND